MSLVSSIRIVVYIYSEYYYCIVMCTTGRFNSYMFSATVVVYLYEHI